jgi:hypothetical protein
MNFLKTFAQLGSGRNTSVLLEVYDLGSGWADRLRTLKKVVLARAFRLSKGLKKGSLHGARSQQHRLGCA